MQSVKLQTIYLWEVWTLPIRTTKNYWMIFAKLKGDRVITPTEAKEKKKEMKKQSCYFPVIISHVFPETSMLKSKTV